MQINLFNQTTFTSQNITAVTCSFEKKKKQEACYQITLLYCLRFPGKTLLFLEVNLLLTWFLLFEFLDKVMLLLSLLFTTVFVFFLFL